MIETPELRMQFDRGASGDMDFGNLFVTDKRTGSQHSRVGVLLVNSQRMLKRAEKIVREYRHAQNL